MDNTSLKIIIAKTTLRVLKFRVVNKKLENMLTVRQYARIKLLYMTGPYRDHKFAELNF